MKKTTLFLLICIFFTSTYSIAGGTNYINSGINPAENPPANSALFTPFFTEDFSGGVPSGWLINDIAGNGVVWKYTTTGPFNPANQDSLSVSGTTASNGYMIVDSDSNGQSVGGENTTLTTPRIDCSGKSNIHIRFNESLKHYNDTTTVLVSNDGANWTEVHNSSAGLGLYGTTPNPNLVDINISAFAGNQDSVYVRFKFSADYSYSWMIDDVELYEVSSMDAAVTDISAPTTSCNLLTAAEAVTIEIHNNGTSTINGGLTATFVLNNGTPVTENVTDSIVAGGTLVYTFTATADLSVPGSHSINAYVSLTNDTILANDTITESLFNGPHVVNATSTYSNGFETATDLEGIVYEDTNADSITFQVSNVLPNNGTNHMIFTGPVADDWFFTTCIRLDSGDVYKLKFYERKTSSTSQANLQIMLGNIQSAGGMNQEILPFTTVNTLLYQEHIVVFSVYLTDNYYIGFHVVNADSIVGYALDDIWIGPDSVVGINKIDNNPISLYPNPSSGILYLNSVNNISADFNIEVMNQVGQRVFSSSANSLNNIEINLQEQSAGVYLMRVLSDKGVISRKITITH